MPTLALKSNVGKPANQIGATRTAAQADLLIKINAAVAAADEAETKATTAQAELVSRSKAVGLLLLEAKKLHPAVKDFEAFLGKVQGLKLSRAYDCMRIAGGRTTDEEIKKATRDRVEKHRTAKKRLELVPTPQPELQKLSVTKPDVTETVELSIDEAQYAAFLDAGERAAERSAHALAKFTGACRILLPLLLEADREKARRLVAKMTRPRDMADHNSTIEKIKALRAKTTANGATEAEMLFALDRAAALMDAYDISAADVQVAKDEGPSAPRVEARPSTH